MKNVPQSIEERLLVLDSYQKEMERIFDIAQMLDAGNPELPGAFTGSPSERINRQMAALGVPGFSL